MIVDYNKLQSNLQEWSNQYKKNLPYPHIVIDNLLYEETLEKALIEFPNVKDDGWIHYIHFNEKKHGLNKRDLIPSTLGEIIDELNSPRFIKYLEGLTGIDNLKSDDSLEGGGLHQTQRGGKLNIHADFMVHTHKHNWRRRINVLVYLNKSWEQSYNGDLELWTTNMSQCEKKVAPLFNRMVIFNTDKDSFHGVPEKVNCPVSDSRKSIALYYFTEENTIPLKNPTNYQARPTDSMLKKVGIWMDKEVVALYTVIKRRFGLSDDFVSKFLNNFR